MTSTNRFVFKGKTFELVFVDRPVFGLTCGDCAFYHKNDRTKAEACALSEEVADCLQEDTHAQIQVWKEVKDINDNQ